MTAPPETPMINRAEISFDRSGFSFNANEKMMEKTFAHVNPMINMELIRIHKFAENINEKKAPIATANENRRKRIGDDFNNKKAPVVAPAILAKK